MQQSEQKNKFGLNATQKGLIIAASIGVPVVVVLLFYVKVEGFDFSWLPSVYATINGLTAITLISAIIAIKNGRKKLHENLMKTSIAFSLLFLLGYVVYHMTSKTTVFGDVNHDGICDAIEKANVGMLRPIYLLLLASHIFLSIGIIPMVLVTYVRGISGNFYDHKKIGKVTWPVWLYIAVTGVTIYFLISPYYL